MTALLGLKTNLRMARLHLITDLRGGGSAFTTFVDQMFGAGVDMIQVRDTSAPAGDLVKQLEAARDIAFEHRGMLVVGRNVEIAARFGADTVHLGASDGDIAAARKQLHQWALVGRSTHDEAQIKAAITEADYQLVGPVFGSSVPGLDLVKKAAELLPIDETSQAWFAVGGITLANLDEVLAAGAARVAVSSAICSASDPVAAATEFATRLREAWFARPGAEEITLGNLGSEPMPEVPEAE